MRKLDDFTDEELQITASVIQSLDIEAEKFFNSNCSEVTSELKLSESDIGEMANDFNHNTAPHILLMDGCGYRILLSTFVNLLIAAHKHNIAEKIMQFREEEKI